MTVAFGIADDWVAVPGDPGELAATAQGWSDGLPGIPPTRALSTRRPAPRSMLCTTPFRTMAETILTTKGRPDLRIIEIDHPLGGIGTEQRDERVEAAASLAFDWLDAER